MASALDVLIMEILHPSSSHAQEVGPESQMVIKRLAERMSTHLKQPRSVVTGWLKCRLSFALLRTTLLCIRATRRKRFIVESSAELEVIEHSLCTVAFGA